MVIDDDNVREWGTSDWSKKSAEYAAMNYVPISMKNDFKRIYPDGISKAAAQYDPAEWPQVQAPAQAQPAPQAAGTEEAGEFEDAA